MGERGNTEVLLRAAAVEVDRAEWQQIDLANVWRELVDGEGRVVDNFHSEERCYVVLAPITEGSERIARNQAGKIRILESILLESAQKNVAIDLGLSPSTVASTLKQCLEQLGLLCTTSRISPLLVAAAHASQIDSQLRWGRVSRLPIQGTNYRVVSVDRPEAELAHVLTPAQYDVIRLLVEGKSHHEIALSRHRSTRTIANQLGAAFRKLGVSGRSELLRRLIMQPSALGRPPAPPAVSAARRSWDEAPITVRRYRPRVRLVGVRVSA
jgi:DNA-binding NarL/FixJ family response regulator